MKSLARLRAPLPEDAALAAGYFLLGLLLQLAETGAGGLNPWIGAVPFALWVGILTIGCVGVAYRRTNLPLMLTLTGAAAVVLLALGGSAASFILLFELVFCPALFGSRRLVRVTEVLAVALLAGVVVLVLILTGDWRAVLITGVTGALVLLMPLSWAGNLRKEQQLTESERLRADSERENALRATEIAQLDAQLALTAERSHMAQDLHDVVAGHLSAIALQTAAAAATEDPQLDRRVLHQVRKDSVTALEQMQQMIALLQAPATDHNNFRADFRAMAGGMAQIADAAASAEAAGSPVTLQLDAAAGVPALIDSTLYRIAREALTNAVKHAPGVPVTLALEVHDESVEMTVRNAIRPSGSAGLASGSGNGLRNMRLRTEQLEGRFEAGESDGGWTVLVRIPLHSVLAHSVLAPSGTGSAR